MNVRKLGRVNAKAARNEQWGGSISDYVVSQTATGARIVGNLVKTPDQLLQLVDPDTPSLVPHLPAIYARLDKLESHVSPILERVLNNRRHLASIEPYLDEIMERFDDSKLSSYGIIIWLSFTVPFSSANLIVFRS